MTVHHHVVRAHVPCVLLLLGLAGCTPHEGGDMPPMAVAGEDQSLMGQSVEVTLDGSESSDPDGKIVSYEWRYTGWPADFMPEVDEDAGTPAPTDPTLDVLSPLPAFCSDAEVDPMRPLQIRYCLVARKAKTTVTLEPGGYRFTLFVTDDKGEVSGDTLDVIVMP